MRILLKLLVGPRNCPFGPLKYSGEYSIEISRIGPLKFSGDHFRGTKFWSPEMSFWSPENFRGPILEIWSPEMTCHHITSTDSHQAI